MKNKKVLIIVIVVIAVIAVIGILTTVIITALGASIYKKSVESITDSSFMSEAKKDAFNSLFEAYKAEYLPGETVKSLIMEIESNNISGDNIISINGESSIDDISELKYQIDPSVRYKVEFEYDEETGLINNLVLSYY